MKIKRFFAPDIRKAMAMVKEELGSDAVIMSNRSVDDGVEIVAARDFDEQAVHNKFQSDIEDDGKPATSKQPEKVAVSEFKLNNKEAHVIPSPRKKGSKGSVTPSPVRRQAGDA